jgi:hypothetical protein
MIPQGQSLCSSPRLAGSGADLSSGRQAIPADLLGLAAPLGRGLGWLEAARKAREKDWPRDGDIIRRSRSWRSLS